MKLWLLTRSKTQEYDTYGGFVIRAETEERARILAQAKAGKYDGEDWIKHAKCEQLTAKGKEEIVLSDFLAG